MHQILIPVLFLLLASRPAAQLELPGGTTPSKAGAQTDNRGLELPSKVRGDLARGRSKNRLILGPAQAAVAAVAPEPARPVSPPEAYPADAEGAARFVFDEVARASDLNAPLVLQAVETLAGLGDVGLRAAHSRLGSMHAPTVATAARVLLERGVEADRRSVQKRLGRELPARASGPLLEAFASGDPTLATPAVLVEWLEHPTVGMRKAARRWIEARLDASYLPAFVNGLRSKREDTRLVIVQLAALLDEPAAANLLFDRLQDSRSRVAAEAARLLAKRDELLPEGLTVSQRLLETAFSNDANRRMRAYALLALVEREDVGEVVVLDERHVDALLPGLRSDEPVFAGACACALAGIGFRSAESRAMDWLDLGVPHALVELASGATFHADFSALQPPALRRLTLITGQRFGSDGPAWQVWWMENARSFRARRAVLSPLPEELETLAIRLRTGGRELSFFGPDASDPSGVEDSRKAARALVYRASREECARLVSFFQREGLFGLEWLPVEEREPLNSLLIRIGDQEKRFEYRSERPAWFGRAVEVVRQLELENRWQAFRPADVLLRDHWETQQHSWSLPLTDADRALRLKDVVLADLAETDWAERDEGVAELERLFRTADVARATDVQPLLALLLEERFLDARARSLFELLEIAARASSTAPNRTIAPELASELFELVLRRFGDEASEETRALLVAGGLETIRKAVASEDELHRALGAHALADEAFLGNDERRELLLGLLTDPDPGVEAAAVRSLGEGVMDDELFTELLLRARVGDTSVRAAGLAAVASSAAGHFAGSSGQEDVFDVFRLALSAGELDVRRAALEGIVTLDDERALPLLISLFGRGSGHELYEETRAGLESFGLRAQGELLRLAASGRGDVRRDTALLLAQLGTAEAAPILITWLTDHSDDARVATELAVLTGEDFRSELEPADSYWEWWDRSVRDDALAWFRGAAERAGFRLPEPEALLVPGTRGGARALLAIVEKGPAHLAERARRLLGELLGAELERPTRGAAREAWLEELSSRIEARYRR